MRDRTDEKLNKFSRFCAAVIFILLLGFMAFLTPMSVFRTTLMSTGAGAGEIVMFVKDNFFLNAIVLFICVAAVYLICLMCEHVKLRKLVVLLLAWTLLFGLAFVCSAKLQPSEDSYIVTFFARQAAKGDYSYYHDYFRCFPFQFGFALYEELFFRLFNAVLPARPEGYSSLALQGINVLFTVLTYYSVLRCTLCVSRSETVTKLTAVLLLFFLPPLLFTTYMYGNVPGFALACTGTWMFLEFRENRRIVHGVLCAVCLTLAVCLKLNCLIFFIAIVIIWVIDLIRKPDMKAVVLLALAAAMVLCVRGLPQKYYEERCGESFGSGVPQLGWMAMGLNEGQSCSGWYDTEYTVAAYKGSGFDRDKTAQTAREAINERLEYFTADPAEAVHFFSRKLLSQWNEPTYQGLWNNQVRKKYSEPGMLYKLICQRFERRLTQLMNYYQQLIFAGFALSLILLLKKKSLRTAVFPLIILGGMLYHLLFEAKSQYAMGYIILMIPVAAYGLARLSAFAARKSRSTRPSEPVK